jgi:PKD domain-containing protein
MRGRDSETAITASPVASFVAEPAEPATGEPVRLLDLSYDPAGDGITARAWDFGDGSTSVEPQPSHRYERDGVYTVRLHVTAPDGRVGTASYHLVVATHDVALTRIVPPTRARAGRQAKVVVVVESRHKAEIAQVELFRQRGVREWEHAGLQTRPVPARGGVEVEFTVSFTDADAEVGHVTFSALATLVGAKDATPDDNALIAPPTLVARRRSG